MPSLRISGVPMSGVLVTRPEPGATETARRLAALGWRPVLAPALVLAPRPFAPAPAAQALLLTSRAAARAIPPTWSPGPLPVLAVGEATAAEARAHGFPQVQAAAGDAEALAALAAATLDPGAGPLLLAVGAGYGEDLATALRAQGFRVIRRIAYAAAPATALPPEAVAALHQGVIAAALFFSPKSAQSALALIRGAGLAATAQGIRALAISPRVAQGLAALPWRDIRVAVRPDQDSLMELLGPTVTHE
jgi:uroporphyrinogen-III synthase